MRKLTQHIVEGDSANHQLKILVTDTAGPGGAHHRYEILNFDPGALEANPSYAEQVGRVILVFQNGPIREVGVNGVTHEALLAILIDRLECFQKGPYKCDENQTALFMLNQALDLLQARTRERIARGVEGTHTK